MSYLIWIEGKLEELWALLLAGSPLLWGKLLETIGALLLAWVAIRALRIEASTRPLRRQAARMELRALREGLEALLERRRRQFGFVEAILVSAGTSLIAIGCGLYLVGLTEH